MILGWSRVAEGERVGEVVSVAGESGLKSGRKGDSCKVSSPPPKLLARLEVSGLADSALEEGFSFAQGVLA